MLNQRPTVQSTYVLSVSEICILPSYIVHMHIHSSMIKGRDDYTISSHSNGFIALFVVSAVTDCLNNIQSIVISLIAFTTTDRVLAC